MNILFYVTCTPNPMNGGIERVSHILAQEFKKYNHRCFCAYFNEIESDYISDIYEETFYIPLNNNIKEKEFGDIICKHNINIILNQVGGFWDAGRMFERLKEKRKFKLITTYHSNPIENKYILENRYSKYTNIKDFVYHILYKISPSLLNKRIKYIKHKLFNKEISISDKYVFLSDKYRERTFKEYFLKDIGNTLTINNPLTYNVFFNHSDYDVYKKKQVLIVARFDELYKRLSEALLIWKNIEKYGYNGWELIIIGHGKDEQIYKKMINNLEIKNIKIIGKQPPEEYYINSSIFMMTSTLEGWPMTIQESMQFGCIPFAYNTFDAVYDIIENNKNGYIIEDKDTETYSKTMFNLMNNSSLLKRLSYSAIESSKKYAANIIAEKWIELIEQNHD